MTRTRLMRGGAARGVAIGAAVVAMTAAAAAQAPARFGIGRQATPQEIAAIDIDIMPDGRGLPPGRGTSADGAAIYATKCAQCHGKTGPGGVSCSGSSAR